MAPFEPRRKALPSNLPGGVDGFPFAPGTLRNHDADHHVRPYPEVYHLTGLDQPESLLVLSTTHPEQRSARFVRRRDARQPPWEGPRSGLNDAARRLGPDVAYPSEPPPSKLPDSFQNGTRRGTAPSFIRTVLTALHPTRARWQSGVWCPTEGLDPLRLLHEIRLRKAPHEVALLREAARLSADGHRRLMRQACPGLFEYELEFAPQAQGAQSSARHAWSIEQVAQAPEPAMTFTVEPGLYVPATGGQVPQTSQGIGRRSEVDVLLTDHHHDVLNQAAPGTLCGIEAACVG